MMVDRTQPFVLADDARPGGRTVLYRRPVRTVTARDADGLAAALDALTTASASGLHAAGFISYEAGHALEPRLAPLMREPAGGLPLMWFGVFEAAEPVDPAAVLPDPAGAWIGAARPGISRAAYLTAFDTVQAAIRAGDIYQANLTFPATVPVAGDPMAIYAKLRARSLAGHGALVWTGTDWLISLSPELFFASTGRSITVRPMKGTAPRGADADADRATAAALQADAKQRAENLMIVDLMRNDLSRVAVAGSVQVPALYTVEPYPTVHQMVSTVTATLDAGTDAVGVLRALFPCGSVTGAPKIRAMEVIHDVEAGPRGAYTGAIGSIAPGGDATFNVAIRTLHLKPGEATASLGLGSGIVADSVGGEEWDECLTKARFLTAGERPVDLIETMAFLPEHGILRLDHHLHRMRESARALGHAFDRHEARNALQAATFRLDGPARVRLVLGASGAIAIETGPMPPAPTEPVSVAIVPRKVAPDDFRLRHKTSDRALYDDPRRAAGTLEVLFADADGQLSEGSFTSLFVPMPDGRYATPPLAAGLLPGVLRTAMIEAGEAVERPLTAADLAQGFCVGNSLRGLIVARLVAEADRG
ncbi:aminodeoxychorismate synthase component I [Sphingomonas sp. FW199]|uniref:aminodeoxychorismate synthase component I n=1 Tax=Sphingomonas sp. FW199 TaxID=3400217 RepID=UPI003CE6723E